MVSVRSERQICGDEFASTALSQQRCSTLISYSLSHRERLRAKRVAAGFPDSKLRSAKNWSCTEIRQRALN
jgi:hypothetical protein